MALAGRGAAGAGGMVVGKRVVAVVNIHPFVEHHQVIAYNFGGKFLVAFLVFPASGAQAPFNIYQAAFMEVFLSQFGKSPPEYNGMPFGL